MKLVVINFVMFDMLSDMRFFFGSSTLKMRDEEDSAVTSIAIVGVALKTKEKETIFVRRDKEKREKERKMFFKNIVFLLRKEEDKGGIEQAC